MGERLVSEGIYLTSTHKKKPLNGAFCLGVLGTYS